MPDIIMTIKARHVRNMRLGVKKYELRKTRPACFQMHNHYTRVWLCESGSGGRIVASFMCRAYPEMTNTDDTLVAKLCAITAAEVQGYRKGGKQRLFGWLIEDFEDYKESGLLPHIVDFGLKRPPQSWCYAKGGGQDG